MGSIMYAWLFEKNSRAHSAFSKTSFVKIPVTTFNIIRMNHYCKNAVFLNKCHFKTLRTSIALSFWRIYFSNMLCQIFVVILRNFAYLYFPEKKIQFHFHVIIFERFRYKNAFYCVISCFNVINIFTTFSQCSENNENNLQKRTIRI